MLKIQQKKRKMLLSFPALMASRIDFNKVGLRYGVQVSITTRNKLCSVCAKVDSRKKRRPDQQVVGCGFKHTNRCVAGATGVVYSKVKRGNNEVDKTSQFFNTWRFWVHAGFELRST